MTTDRTLWTPLEEKDFPDMLEMAGEPDTFKYLKFLQVMTDEEYRQFLYAKLEQIRNQTGYHWAVRLATNGAFIGAVNLNLIKGTSRMQIGCQLKRACWNQGFASELTRRVLDFATDEIRLTEVYGVFEKDNFISRRLLEKLGFTWVETKKEPTGIEVEVHKYIPSSKISTS
jgi:ribosomal-protein-alanine N-acetyltransferase